jgi:hypothetical protein
VIAAIPAIFWKRISGWWQQRAIRRQLALPAKPLQIVPYYAHPDFGWSYESPGGAEARFVVVFSMTSLVKGRTITITDVRVDAGKPKITSLTLGTFEPVTDLLTHRVL